MADFRFRNEGDLLVLQINEHDESPYHSSSTVIWRDATTEDLLNIEFCRGFLSTEVSPTDSTYPPNPVLGPYK